MIVHTSNRTEELLDALAEVVREPAGGPTVPECIVVQGPAMERWLAMQLAERFGVWANPDFPYPRSLLERAFEAALEPDHDPAAWRRETLTWSVAALLLEHLDQPAFEPLRRYLADDRGGLMLAQLGWRIADTFDRYAVYRPELVARWEAGGEREPDWQPLLWRALVERHGPAHFAARAEAFREKIATADGPLPGFPTRVSVFGLSALPVAQLELLAALARRVEVHVFQPSPSRALWRAVAERGPELAGLLADGADAEAVETALALSDGHPLLAGHGRAVRDQLLALAALTGPAADDRHDVRDGSSMLTHLQADILADRRRGAGESSAPALELAEDDRSISVHACHGPMREAEVLRDQLLALFAGDADLQPRDVLVVAPDIEGYAPYIEAVFGVAGGDEPRIPFRIAGRAPRATLELVGAFNALVETLRGRLTAPAVLDLLALAPVRERFDIAAEELDTLRGWVEAAGVRWAEDAEHREALGQPALADNTWRFGLDRLLLGYAMPSDGALFAGTLPYDDVEGSDAEALGKLAELCETLFAARRALAGTRTVPEWRDALVALLEDGLHASSQTAWQDQLLRVALDGLAEEATAAGFERPVDIQAVLTRLEHRLGSAPPTRGLLGGGVTFGDLRLLRGIPFRVVCLMGLNDDAFPAAERRLGFDRLAATRRIGDPSARDEDRLAFLEAVLAARDQLVITFTGQSIQDNTARPPSVVVSDLLDALAASFTVPEERARESDPDDGWPADLEGPMRRKVVVRHPIQAFSPRYFDATDNARLFSYSRADRDSARCLRGTCTPAEPFLDGPLSPVDTTRHLTVETLAHFLANPARALLQARLRLYLGTEAPPLEEREPMALDGLARWGVGDELLGRLLAGEEPARAREALRAAGRLPLGSVGACVLADLSPEVAAIAAAAGPWRAGERRPLEIDLTVGDTQLTGVLHDVWPRAQLRSQYSRVGGGAELGLWVRHLALAARATAGGDGPAETVLVGRATKGNGPATVRFAPPDDPAALLAELVALYWRGLAEALPFFPRASRAYVETLRAGDEPDEAKARREARKAYEGGYVRGDRDDAYVAQAFGDTDPTAPEAAPAAPELAFDALARAVFEPLLDHRVEEDGP